MVSSDINSNTKRKILDDPGSGHRIMIAKISIQSRKTKIKKRFVKSSWNFKKANWTAFSNALEIDLAIDKFDFSQSPDQLCRSINSTIIHNAKKYIPAGKQKQYKYFWNKDLQHLKLNRDTTFKYHVFAPMGRFQLESIYLYFPPSSQLVY